MPDECVAVVGGTPFNFAFINIAKVLPAWNSYGTSPTLKGHAWSALITRALSRNFALFSPDPVPTALSPALSRITTTPGAGDPRMPYPLVAFRPYCAAEPPIFGLLALHLRRGDYAEHCANLAFWGSEYNVWNKFGNTSLPNPDPKSAYPLLPDHLSVPAGMSRHNASYAHCWPTPDAVLVKVRAVRAEAAAAGQKFSTVYMATNGEAVWVGEIADRLRAEGWALVGSSLDMQLARDEQAVSQAVDMGVLVAAETFIGNGFSSVTSNVVQLRLAGGRHVNTNRFW
ncbi:hypothetical protein DFH08DRAFT_950296 [Mycena albidolilacea]|uniref:Uncharacterized protein n=1 Tax=Mycena albidolilacea TaxID=1033008 RepID=A0AAD7F2J1_9AGAR|nr:hypothetical protein DFH08DRAFT_950296 [Mycena albidolilacea]